MNKKGSISHCKYTNCRFACCDFQQGNFIGMYPSEWEFATGEGFLTNHLKTIEKDRFGGRKVVCQAKDCSTCDQGYKPVDCQSYPLFPERVDEDGSIAVLQKGEKCPLVSIQLESHSNWVKEKWAKLSKENPQIEPWIQAINFIGYTRFISTTDKTSHYEE